MQNDYCTVECRDRARRARKKVAAGLDPEIDARTTRRLEPRTIEILDAVRAFLGTLDYPVGVRSVCYHLLSTGVLKSTREFGGAQGHISAARLRDEGDNDIPDDAFEDRTRKLEYFPGATDVQDYLEERKAWYSRTHWTDQPTVPILLTEKDGYNFLSSVTAPEHVRLFLSKGNHGRCHLVKLAEHCAQIINNGQRVAIGYFGDFDADGVKMELVAENGNDRTGVAHREGLRQILNRKHDLWDCDAVSWTRLGLTSTQLLELDPQAWVPAKRTSNNFEWYKAEYFYLFSEEAFSRAGLDEAFPAIRDDGTRESEDYDTHVFGGECDALSFATMSEIAQDFIDSCKDPERWAASVAVEEKEKQALQELKLRI